MHTGLASSFKARIRQEALRAGFDLFGVTTPEPTPHLDVYHRWIAQGMHGEMGYLASPRALECRSDPRLLLAECRSVVVVGMGCFHPLRSGMAARSEVQVASYALGADYHHFLLRRLKSLVHVIEGLLRRPVAHRLYTDTGPVMERELAQRAGLGWIGKNTCLIHPQRGSYFLLAELLLGIELEPDAPFEHDRCGSCTRCIDACPSQCILPNHTVDARRCISYLTIELRGSIPEAARPLIGGWLFGCDLCQQVCPWNLRFARPSLDPALEPRPFLDPPDVGEFLGLTPEGYRSLLRGSPLRRAKRHGLVRNAAIVAGNLGDPQYVPPLSQVLLQDPEPTAREHAAWALGQLATEHSRQALRQASRAEKDPSALAATRSALAHLEEPLAGRHSD